MSASPGLAPATSHSHDRQPDDQQPDDQKPRRELESSCLDPILLPDVRCSGRARRRRERRRRHLRRLGLALTTVALVAGVGLVLVALAGRGSARRETAVPGGAQPPAPPAAPVVSPVLVAHRDASGRASSLTVLVPSASGKGGTLVMVPAGTMTEVVSLGLEPVRQSLDLGGPSHLQSTVENLLGATLGGVVVVDDAGVADLLAAAGPLAMRVPERVEQVSPGGRVEVLYEAGLTTLDPSGAGPFLAAKGRENDLARLTRHQAFWDAWLSRLRERPSTLPSRPPELNAAMRALADGPVDTRMVPVQAFGSAGDGSELYKVREDELARLVSVVFPTTARPGGAERPRVQVLNGTGALGLADAVRSRLGAGFDVHLTGNAASFGNERTEIVFYDRDQEVVADRVRQALGVGTLVMSRRPLDVVDVTVIVGKDFRP
ncbi:MAG: LytR C-terminal domain-containing protein [Actinomycetota bacterium]|nr:LytR C-terminal domain-containing protein [Actinomycetota bacterium]